MSVIEAVARWARNEIIFSPISRERAAEAILDTVSCIIAGADNPATIMVRTALSADDSQAGRSAVIGGKATAPGLAALMNGTAAHALDYDDTFRPLMGHASAVLVPALLSTAQMAGADGNRMIEAYLVGLEAQAVIGAGVNPGHYAAGWHATSTVGTIGAAAGTAWLLGLDEAGITRAMSLAVSMAAGIKGQFGKPVKPLHAGLAARNAVEAAMLAAGGMTGRPDIIEHGFGFEKLYAASGEPWQALLPVIGKPHCIETIGLTQKRHPCCASAHNTLDMVFDLKARTGFVADEVLSVETLVGSINKNNLPYTEPADEMQARFSMNYCVALALLKNRLGIADFSQTAVDDPATRRFLPLVRMRAYAAEDEDPSGYMPHHIEIRLRDGRVLTAQRSMEKGTISDPFDESDRHSKYSDCNHGRLAPHLADDLYERLSTLEQQTNFNFISDAFATVR